MIFTNSSINRTIKLSEAIDKNTIKLIKETNTDFFTKNKDFIINTELLKNTKYLTIVDKIELKSNELIKFANVKAGLQAYEIGKGTPTITKKMKDNRIYHSMKKETNKHYKYLNGVDVCRYSINWSGEYLKYGNNLAAPRTFDLYSTPRILVRQIPSKPPHCINACFLNEIILNDRNSMNIIDISLNPYFLLGILNSKLISFWFQYKFGKLQRGLFPQFKINELKTFPIVKLNLNDNNIQKQKYNKIIELVENILNIQKQINTIENEQERYNLQKQSTIIDEEIDKIVYELYDLTQEEINIIEK